MTLPYLHSIFETTIRYLGGLLSAYELTDEKHPELLDQARKLADKMSHGWVGVSPQIPATLHPHDNNA